MRRRRFCETNFETRPLCDGLLGGAYACGRGIARHSGNLFG